MTGNGSRIEATLRAAVNDCRVPGVGLIVRKDGVDLHRSAHGDQQPDTPKLLASATKLASATAIMALVDEGLIGLDEPVRTYLPEFSDEKGGLTMRHLLAQTHGLPFGHPSIPHPQQDNGMTLATSVAAIAADVQLEVPIGSRFRYQPAAAYHIAGRVAEVAADQPWADLFAARVTKPLRMDDTSYGETRNPRIGGGAASTLDDYANLLQMHLDDGVFEGERVLSQASVREMRRNQVGSFGVTGTPAKPEVGYGLTWWFDKLDDGVPVQFCVGGGFGAIPWINEPRAYVAFLLVQKRLSDAVPIYDAILADVDALVAAG